MTVMSVFSDESEVELEPVSDAIVASSMGVKSISDGWTFTPIAVSVALRTIDRPRPKIRASSDRLWRLRSPYAPLSPCPAILSFGAFRPTIVAPLW